MSGRFTEGSPQSFNFTNMTEMQFDEMVSGALAEETTGVVVKVRAVPYCAVCRTTRDRIEVPAIADMRTDSGQWANLCKEHTRLMASAFGTGRGQLYKVV